MVGIYGGEKLLATLPPAVLVSFLVVSGIMAYLPRNRHATPGKRHGVTGEGGAWIVCMIEAKASRSDLICAKQKRVYNRSLMYPIADYCWFILSDGVPIATHEYPMWGVINERMEVVRRAKRLTRRDDKLRTNMVHQAFVNIAYSTTVRAFPHLFNWPKKADNFDREAQQTPEAPKSDTAPNVSPIRER